MKIQAYMAPGHGKETSEDRLLVFHSIVSKGFYSAQYDTPIEGCIGIFDGVGGIAGGKEASSYAAEQMMHFYAEPDPEILRGYLYHVGINLLQSRKNATTATGICILNGRVLLFHVGNTRVYGLSDEFLERLTTDQTVLEERYKGKIITQEIKDAIGHEITGCLGGSEEGYSARVQVKDITSEFSQTKKIIMTCDGIHDYLNAGQLEKVITGEYTLEQIVDLAHAEGSDDDCSILLLDLEE